MPVPWEALIPFGKPAPMSLCPLLSLLGLVTALFGAAGTLLNVSKRAQNQGKVSQVHLIKSPYSFIYPPMCPIPASEISYRLLGGYDDGQRPATHRTCTEADGTNLTFPTFLYTVYSIFVSLNL